MKDKILFWLDYGLKHYGIAYFLNQQHDCELFSIIETHKKPKKFYENQKLVPFKKIWFFHDYVSTKNTPPDMKYLSYIEKKYGINIWLIAYTERFFSKSYKYHKFSRNEILSLIEQECKLFEQVLDEINPNFIIMRDVDLHHVQLLHEICKARGIKILSILPTKMGFRWIISDTDKLHYDPLNLKKVPQNQKTFDELRNYLNKYSQNKISKDYVSSSRINFLSNATLSSLYNVFFGDAADREKFMSIGNSRSKVFVNMFSLPLKRMRRQLFLDNHSKMEIKNDEKFVYFPLHVSPERYVDISAPFFSNQLEVITNIAKALPVGYKLYVKEHFAMKTRHWREISFYKEILAMPNVELIHHSVSSTEIIKKSSLVITIAGTSSLEAAFYEKPSIVMAHIIYIDFLPFIYRIKNLEELPSTIRTALKSKVNLTDLNRFIEIIQKESFVYDPYVFNNKFNPIYNSLYSDVSISESQMKDFLNHNKNTFEMLALEHLKKIKSSNSEYSVTN